MKKRTDFEIIDEIQSVRSKNNINWMDILRLIFELDPARARKLMAEINSCDDKVSSLVKELARNG